MAYSVSAPPCINPSDADVAFQEFGLLVKAGESPPVCPFLSPDWDDISPKRSVLMSYRLQLKNLAKNPMSDIYYVTDDEKTNCFKVLIIGPEDTPYAGGFFHFYARLGPDYPQVPPRVCAMSCYRFGSYTRFHPNFYRNGHMCLSILNTWEGEKWSSEMDLQTLFLSIRHLFTKEALCHEPNFRELKGCGTKEVWIYDMYVQHETLRVAVLDTLKRWEDHDLPPTLVKHMVAHFFQHYDTYIKACHSYLEYDSHPFQVTYVQKPFTPNFKAILKDLIAFHRELLPFKDKILQNI